jgi:hypothetical protein
LIFFQNIKNGSLHISGSEKVLGTDDYCFNQTVDDTGSEITTYAVVCYRKEVDDPIKKLYPYGKLNFFKPNK